MKAIIIGIAIIVLFAWNGIGSANTQTIGVDQIRIMDNQNDTLIEKESEESASYIKLYLRYISGRVLRESKGSSYDVYITYGNYATVTWDDYFLTGDISGTSYTFDLLASSDYYTDFTAKYIAYNGGAGDAYNWYSYVNYPAPRFIPYFVGFKSWLVMMVARRSKDQQLTRPLPRG